MKINKKAIKTVGLILLGKAVLYTFSHSDFSTLIRTATKGAHLFTQHSSENQINLANAGKETLQSLTCGDGIRDELEECDAGDLNSAEGIYGCTSECKVSYGWGCSEGKNGQSKCHQWLKNTRSLSCGDGYYENGEECDDYWWDIGDACVGCVIQSGYACSYYNNGVGNVGYCFAACGDGKYNSGEACDLGSSNNGNGYGCSSTCTLTSGYGCKWSTYPISSTSEMTQSSCTTGCGDGFYDTGEACDTGYADIYGNSNTGCSSTCTVISGYTCTWTGSTSTSTSSCTYGVSDVCGDGFRTGTEACDDDDTDSGDGCSSTCTVETGYSCTGGSASSADTCTTVCGDSKKVGSEACDDGDTDSGDGCSSTCTVETGYSCTGGSSSAADTCATVCGDSKVVGAEACDDGDTDPGDGCSATCTVESGYTCTGGSSSSASTCTSTASVCGNGFRTGAEACDDGDTTSGDGCSSTCTVESGYSCTGGSSSSADTCTATTWSGASLTECETIAGYFNNTCSSSTAVSISSVPTVQFTCTSNGLACASTSTCTFDRQLCATCTTDNDGVVLLRVQTNSIPDHCVYTTTNALASSQIDFSVALQTDLTLTTTLSVTTQANVNYYQCSDVSTWVASVPSRVYYTNTAGSTYADKIVGVAFNGVPIMHGGQEYPYDPYFPKLSSGSAVAYESDTCLGNNDHTSFYHYYTYSPCITETAMKYNLAVKECSDNAACDLNPLSYASAMVSSNNRTLQKIGIAKDGYLIYGPYKADGTLWQPCDVDACNGKSIDGSYAYVSTMFYPYTVGCWGPSSTAYYSPTCSSNPKTCSFGSYLANSVGAFLLVIAAIFLTY